MPIADHKVVRIEYTVKNAAGEVVDTSDGGPPLAYIHGTRSIVPGLERALAGLDVGDERDVVVPPEDAYGLHVPEAVMRLPRDFFQGTQVSVGDIFEGEDDSGNRLPVRVVRVADDHVEVDANHPLAGETLHFHVAIREVRDATPAELANGAVD
jgi:FKBP-type peptidyl-prolyl cis-trans isomerase SlyD